MTRHLIKDVICSSEYHELLEQIVRYVHVEFLTEDDIKPHVVLRFLFENQARLGHKNVTSCMIEVTNDNVECPEGEVVIRFHDTGPDEKPIHRLGLVGFRYPTRKTGKVRDLLEVLCGTAQSLERDRQSDLCSFQFVTLNPDTEEESVDGCRDIVTQWVIRLHQERYIHWEAEDIVSGGDIQSDIPSKEFHSFIAKGYKDLRSEKEKMDGKPRRIVITDDIAMHQGQFLDGSVKRITHYLGNLLPYA